MPFSSLDREGAPRRRARRGLKINACAASNVERPSLLFLVRAGLLYGRLDNVKAAPIRQPVPTFRRKVLLGAFKPKIRKYIIGTGGIWLYGFHEKLFVLVSRIHRIHPRTEVTCQRRVAIPCSAELISKLQTELAQDTRGLVVESSNSDAQTTKEPGFIGLGLHYSVYTQP